MLPFSWRFKCPWISLAPVYHHIFDHFIAGNPTHPILYPDANFQVQDPEDLSFWERLKFFMITQFLFLLYKNAYVADDVLTKKYFGDNYPPLEDLHKNMSMMFINYNPIFENIRPLMANTISIGDGMHILPPKPLPEDLKQFLDDANEGVIYFSLGSIIKSYIIGEENIKAMLAAFSELPYRVLWKFESKTVYNLPSNIRTEKWLPQQDVLRHPNVKVFIMQGGIQSLHEAVSNHLPVIGIPFYGDQMKNVATAVKRGYGIRLDRNEITKDKFKNAILEIMNNVKYREKAKELGEIMHDEPMTGLQKAVWWTEYVLRHKGAKHLKNIHLDKPLYQYFFLDVLGFIFLIIFIVSSITYIAVKFVLRKLLLLFRGELPKIKTT